MKINSDESLKRAEETFARFGGDWTAVHEASTYVDGVLVVGRSAPRRDGAGEAGQRHAAHF